MIPMYNPQQVRDARNHMGHSQTEAAALVHRTMRAWQDWESGARNVDPAAFELYLIKTGQVETPN